MVNVRNSKKLPQQEYFCKYSPVSSMCYERLRERLSISTYRKGENLVVPGQIQDEIYFVLDGIQMSYYGKGDKVHVMQFTYPQDICIVPDSFTLRDPSKYTLTCLTASTLASVSFRELHLLFDDCQDLERAFRIMTTKMLAGVLEKHLELRTLRIEERFRKFCERSGHLLNEVPHKHLASYLNIDATNFSKLLNTVRIG